MSQNSRAAIQASSILWTSTSAWHKHMFTNNPRQTYISSNRRLHVSIALQILADATHREMSVQRDVQGPMRVFSDIQHTRTEVFRTCISFDPSCPYSRLHRLLLEQLKAKRLVAILHLVKGLLQCSSRSSIHFETELLCSLDETIEAPIDRCFVSAKQRLLRKTVCNDL
jgi:hypothetical protein